MEMDFFEGKKPKSHIVLTSAALDAMTHLSSHQKNKIKTHLLKLKIADVRPRSPLFRALGDMDPPVDIEIDGQPYTRVEIFKHDSWAATALYRGAKDQVVCKFNRQQPIFGMPMRWLGYRLAARENKCLKLLVDLTHIPPCRDLVVANGQVLSHVSAHTYVEATPLRRYQKPLKDDFFKTLQQILEIIHQNNISYMDLNKQENILVDTEGNPCLIDFQICFHLPKRWPGNSAPMRYLLRLLQESDRYHLMKHLIRFRPDLLEPQALAAAKKRPWFLNVYRSVQIPLRTCRRQLLVALGFRSRSGRVDSESFVETGIRQSETKTNIRHDQIKIADCDVSLRYDDDAKTISVLTIRAE